MRPTLKQLQYLVAIADTGSFRNAADKMNVSQPSLSSQIQTMEFELDAELVERTPKGALLTPKGAHVVVTARDILRRVEKLKDDVHRKPNTLSGHVRLGVISTVGPYLLPYVIGELHKTFPDVRLSIHDKRTTELDVMLKEGTLDVLISTKPDHAHTDAMTLFDEDLWIAVPKDSALASDKPVTNLEELKGAYLLGIGEGSQVNYSIQSLANVAGAYVSSEYQGSGLDATRIMAGTGSGVAVMPSLYAILEAAQDPNICLRRVDDPRFTRAISLIWRDTSPLIADFGKLALLIKAVARRLFNEHKGPHG